MGSTGHADGNEGEVGERIETEANLAPIDPPAMGDGSTDKHGEKGEGGAEEKARC